MLVRIRVRSPARAREPVRRDDGGRSRDGGRDGDGRKRRDRGERWLPGAAGLVDERTAVRERAAARTFGGSRRLARDRQQPAFPAGDPDRGGCRDKAGGVGVPRRGEQIGRPALLDQASRVENSHPVTTARDKRKVMADEHDGRADLLPQHLQKIENLACHRRVQAGGRLVEDEQPRTRRERRRDADPLLLPTRQLVRPPPRDHGRLRQAHRSQQLQRPPAGCGA